MPAPTARDICEVALRWEGVPYRHQGRTRHGVDCGGLMFVVGWETGVWPRSVDVQNYPRVPDGSIKGYILSVGMYAVRSFDWRQPVPAHEIEPGTVLLMDPESPRFPCHLGIWCGDCLIHASAPDGRVVRHGLRGKYQKMVQTVYRYPGVDYRGVGRER